MRYLPYIFLLALVSACSPVRVTYDYDKAAQFSTYNTYNYYSPLNTGLSELDTKRLLNTLDAQMQAKGFALSDTPDFLINIQSQEYQSARRNNVGLGVGGGGGNI